MKRLEEMSLEELWQLFPVELTQHNPIWNDWAKEEILNLETILNVYSPIINHIGSTAIPGIKAKPIIDILVELNPDVDFDKVKSVMQSAGYICMNRQSTRMSFNKGYAPEGYAPKVFHIHFHRVGDNAEILFRDYLIENRDLAREYERLKLSLLPQFKYDRDGYTAAKSDFINQVLTLAGMAEK